MNEPQKEETNRLYEEIIKEVVKNLKQKSDRGQLQMSESEITTFRDFWMEYLQELRRPQLQQQKISKSQENQFNQQPIATKEQTEEIQDLVQKKVKKGNNNLNNDQLEESQIKQDENESVKELSFSEESDAEEQQEKIEQVSKIEQKEAEEIIKQERYEQKKYERDREKTLFDKYKELLNIEEQKKNEIKREEQDEQNGDDDNQFRSEIQIYAQKYNTDNSTVSRIRPNRQQRINLEYVLIKNKNEEIFLYSSQLSFIFRTNSQS